MMRSVKRQSVLTDARAINSYLCTGLDRSLADNKPWAVHKPLSEQADDSKKQTMLVL